MAKTRQTAKLSTGGRMHRKELQTRAAQKARPVMKTAPALKQAVHALGRERRMDMLRGRTDVRSVRFVQETGFVVTFEQERHNNREWTLTYEEAGELFGRHVPLFVRSNLWDTMSVAVACGLHKSLGQAYRHA